MSGAGTVKLLGVVLTAVCLSWTSGAADVGAAASVQAPRENAAVSGIAGAPDVLAVLAKVREALGGRERLDAVRTMSVKGTTTFGKEASTPFTQLFLIPNRFQERLERVTYTVDDVDYWQVPEPSAQVLSEARRRKMFAFTTQVLMFLLRAPAQMPLRATLQNGTPSEYLGVTFDGPQGFSRLVEIDARSMRLRAIESTAVLAEGGAERRGTSRTLIENYARVGAIDFPLRTRTRMAGTDLDVTTNYTAIVVDRDVAVADFQRPRR